MQRIDIFHAADGAIAFWWRQTGAAFGPLVLYVASATLMGLTPENPSPAWLLVISFALIGFCAGAIMGATTLLRQALVHEGLEVEPAHGRYGFHWTAQEWRFITANAAAIGLAVLPLFLIGLPFGSLMLVVAQWNDPVAQTVGAVGGVVAFLAAVYVAVRVSLAPAATVAQSNIVLGWGLTRGHFWQVLGVYVLVLLTAGAIMLVLTGIGAFVGLLFREALAGAKDGPMRAGAAIGYALGQAFAQFPLLAGASAWLYARLRAEAIKAPA